MVVRVITRKTEIFKKNWMSFPGFANQVFDQTKKLQTELFYPNKQNEF